MTPLLFASFTERLAPGLIRGVTSPNAEPFYTYAYALIIFLALMVVTAILRRRPRE